MLQLLFKLSPIFITMRVGQGNLKMFLEQRSLPLAPSNQEPPAEITSTQRRRKQEESLFTKINRTERNSGSEVRAEFLPSPQKNGSKKREVDKSLGRLDRSQPRLDNSFQKYGTQVVQMSRTNPQSYNQMSLTSFGRGNRGAVDDRAQAAERLEFLSSQLYNQISNATSKIEQFRSALTAELTERLYSLHQEVIRVVEETFRGAKRHFEQQLSRAEKRAAGQVIKIRQKLQAEYVKVEQLRGKLSESNWRTITAQMMADNTEGRVETLVVQSRSGQIRRERESRVGRPGMEGLEKQLNSLVRFPPDK